MSESQTNQNEEEQQRGCEARQQEISHMQEILETKVQLLQEVHTHTLIHTLMRLHFTDTPQSCLHVSTPPTPNTVLQ